MGTAGLVGIRDVVFDLTSLKGARSLEIVEGSQTVEIEGVSVTIIALEDLVRVKRTSDRPRDRADADELTKINR